MGNYEKIMCLTFNRNWEAKKLSLRKTSALYDSLYEKAAIILSRYNPCGFLEGRPPYCAHGCCQCCEHLSRKNGCKRMSLSCKLYLCESAAEEFPECFSRLTPLIKKAFEYDLLGERMIKEEVLEKLFPLSQDKRKLPKSSFFLATR